MTTLEIIFSSANILIIGFSVYLLLITIRKNQEWNRRKTTHEFLNDLIFKEYTELSKIITIDLEIQVNDKTIDYSDSIKSLVKPKKVKKLKHTLTKIFNIFEILSISIKNSIIDEDIAYDYLGLMYAGYHRYGLKFIEESRQKNSEIRTYENFEKCAKKWAKRMKDSVKTKEVKSKPKL